MWFILPLFVLCATLSAHAAVGATVARVPEGGLQPQVVVDVAGTIHMIYLTGAPNAAKIRYTRSTDSCRTFGPSLDVNTSDTPAIATGTMRGPQLAVGPNGTVHVAWMSSPEAMCYARLPRGAHAFEKPRNLVTSHPGLDGGGSIAAGADGRVYVAWHAPERKDGDESSRRVWLATSADDGATFSPERAIFDRPTGACGCCGMRLFAAPDGALFCLYRGASEKVHRGLFLLASADGGATFSGDELAPMNLGTCLMSTASFAAAGDETLVAWETKGKVLWGRIGASKTAVARAIPAGEGDNQKYPSLTVSRRTGDILLTWTEDTHFGKPGTLCWQVYNSAGVPRTGGLGKVGGVPAFSFPAAVVDERGNFTILY